MRVLRAHVGGQPGRRRARAAPTSRRRSRRPRRRRPPSGAECSRKLCAPAGGCQAITPARSQCAPRSAASGRGSVVGDHVRGVVVGEGDRPAGRGERDVRAAGRAAGAVVLVPGVVERDLVLVGAGRHVERRPEDAGRVRRPAAAASAGTRAASRPGSRARTAASRRAPPCRERRDRHARGGSDREQQDSATSATRTTTDDHLHDPDSTRRRP